MASDSNAFRSALIRSGCVFSVLICCGWTQEIGAVGFTYYLGYRAEHSDNVFRIPDERAGQSEVINSINAGFTFLEDSSTFIARVVGSAVYQDYYRETFENQKNLTLDARGEYFFVPRVLSWVAVDGFRKSTDRSAPTGYTREQTKLERVCHWAECVSASRDAGYAYL